MIVDEEMEVNRQNELLREYLNKYFIQTGL